MTEKQATPSPRTEASPTSPPLPLCGGTGAEFPERPRQGAVQEGGGPEPRAAGGLEGTASQLAVALILLSSS